MSKKSIETKNAAATLKNYVIDFVRYGFTPNDFVKVNDAMNALATLIDVKNPNVYELLPAAYSVKFKGNAKDGYVRIYAVKSAATMKKAIKAMAGCKTEYTGIVREELIEVSLEGEKKIKTPTREEKLLKALYSVEKLQADIAFVPGADGKPFSFPDFKDWKKARAEVEPTPQDKPTTEEVK